MNPDFPNFLTTLWQKRPGMVILLVGGIIVFVLLVIDTHRHRKKLKRRHRPKHH